MSQVLYRKYRSKNFDQLFGQDHIKSTLKYSIQNDSIAHAYIFSGPRGTGKTSTARIFAKEINYSDDQNKNEQIAAAIENGSALDIIEIDAASNRGIEEIRELREKVHFSPVVFKYKVYIIDEVHMLTKEAFNALLKTLEEPPKHVVFILATTEIDKVPITIISRSQRFDFKLGSDQEIESKINYILESESKKIDKEAVDLIIKLGRGSFRDTETILDKVLSSAEELGDKIDLKRVESLLALASGDLVDGIVNALLKNESGEVFLLLGKVSTSGINIKYLINQILEELRKRMLKKVTSSKGEFSIKYIIKLISNLIEANSQLKNSPVDILPLEIAILKSLDNEASIPEIREQKIIEEKPKQSELKKELKAEPINELKKEANKKTESDSILSLTDIENGWDSFLERIKVNSQQLIGFIAKSKLFAYENGIIAIKVGYKFHKQRIDSAASKEIINKSLEEAYGRKLTLECSLDESLKEVSDSKPLANNSNEELVEEIFGE